MKFQLNIFEQKTNEAIRYFNNLLEFNCLLTNQRIKTKKVPPASITPDSFDTRGKHTGNKKKHAYLPTDSSAPHRYQ